MMTREELSLSLSQVTGEQIEYQPGYFVWQMETEVRDVIETAARKQLALMAEKCGTCGGDGIGPDSWNPDTGTVEGHCPTCRGWGKVYAIELVERVAWVFSFTDESDRYHRAIAVLDALNGLDQEAPR